MRNIAELIEKSGMEPQEISEKSRIPMARLKQLIEGKTPTLLELRGLARSLNLDYTQFIERNSPSSTVMLFRDTMGNRLKSSHELTVELLSNQLEQTLGMIGRHQNLRWLDLFKVEKYNYFDALTLSETFREHFFENDQVSPLTNLPQIVVEKLNIILVVPPKLKIDGASALIDGNAFVFVALRTFVPRMLFTLAHEIGHLLAHHQKVSDFALFDSLESTGGIRTSTQTQERFADAFASCLLMPPIGVGIALKKIREIYKIVEDVIGDIEILYLAHIFGVSFQVAARRCEDLDLISRGAAFSLYERICKEHGNPEKRARELKLPSRPGIEFPVVSPQLLRRAIERVRHGDISVGRAAKNINLSISSLMNAHSQILAGH